MRGERERKFCRRRRFPGWFAPHRLPTPPRAIQAATAVCSRLLRSSSFFGVGRGETRRTCTTKPGGVGEVSRHHYALCLGSCCPPPNATRNGARDARNLRRDTREIPRLSSPGVFSFALYLFFLYEVSLVLQYFSAFSFFLPGYTCLLCVIVFFSFFLSLFRLSVSSAAIESLLSSLMLLDFGSHLGWSVTVVSLCECRDCLRSWAESTSFPPCYHVAVPVSFLFFSFI